MFEFNTWVVDTLISGVKNKAFSKEWAAVQLANYYVKNRVTEADIMRFEAASASSAADFTEDFSDGDFAEENLTPNDEPADNEDAEITEV